MTKAKEKGISRPASGGSAKSVKILPAAQEKMIEEKIKAETLKNRYLLAKEALLKREKKNDSKVIFLRAGKEFWKVFGKSAIYYANIIAPALNKKVNIWEDSDYGVTSKTGVVIIKDIDGLFEQMKEQLHLKESNNRGRDDLRAIQLGRRITAEELNTMIEKDEMKMKMLEKMLTPVVPWHEMKKEIMELLRRTREAVRKMDGCAQREFGDDMVIAVRDMIEQLSLASSGAISSIDALTMIANDVYKFKAYLFCDLTLRLTEITHHEEMAKLVAKVDKQVTKEMEKEVREREEQMEAAAAVAAGEETEPGTDGAGGSADAISEGEGDSSTGEGASANDASADTKESRTAAKPTQMRLFD